MALSDIDIKSLPSTVTKNIQFVSGAVDFGYLQDGDQQQPINRQTPGGQSEAKRVSVSHRATQTD
jgi:hypothetical protein